MIRATPSAVGLNKQLDLATRQRSVLSTLWRAPTDIVGWIPDAPELHGTNIGKDVSLIKAFHTYAARNQDFPGVLEPSINALIANKGERVLLGARRDPNAKR